MQFSHTNQIRNITYLTLTAFPPGICDEFLKKSDAICFFHKKEKLKIKGIDGLQSEFPVRNFRLHQKFDFFDDEKFTEVLFFSKNKNNHNTFVSFTLFSNDWHKGNETFSNFSCIFLNPNNFSQFEL